MNTEFDPKTWTPQTIDVESRAHFLPDPYTPQPTVQTGAFGSARWRRSTLYPPVPPGIYEALSIHGQFRTARSGLKGLSVKFAIAKGEYRDRWVWKTFWFSEAAMNYCRKEIELLQLTLPDSTEFPRQMVRLHISAREHNGDLHNEIDHIELIGPDPRSVQFDSGISPPPVLPDQCSHDGDGGALQA
jgi:hypothetical protein